MPPPDLAQPNFFKASKERSQRRLYWNECLARQLA